MSINRNSDDCDRPQASHAKRKHDARQHGEVAGSPTVPLATGIADDIEASLNDEPAGPPPSIESNLEVKSLARPVGTCLPEPVSAVPDWYDSDSDEFETTGV